MKAEFMPIEDLSELSSKINEASDRATELLRDAEERLRVLNIGVEAFVHLGPDRDWREDGTAFSEQQTLGWAKHHAEWRLVLQLTVYRETLPDHGDWVVDSKDLFPILDTSRESRIAALEKLDGLVQALKEKGEDMLEAVDKAANVKI